MKLKIRNTVFLGVIVAFGTQLGSQETSAARANRAAIRVPIFKVDPSWLKLEGQFGQKGNWMFAAFGGVGVDQSNDHVWLLERPETLTADEGSRGCCIAAPRVTEFDPEGHFLQGWGGPGPGYDWPESGHGIRVDYKGYVWITGNGKKDNQILKFTKTGKFILQIGHPGQSKGSTDPENMNEPTNTFVDPKTNEVFVTDGYINRRVIVFDADTGTYKRMWGAYGNKPDDTVPRIRRAPFNRPEDLPVETLFEGPPPQQFNLPHDILVSNDDLVYVADRSNNRIQVFKPDGTFVKEAFIDRKTGTAGGTAITLAISADPQQQFLYVGGGQGFIRIVNRETLEVVGQIGRFGHFPGQFYRLHGIATDSKGNLYETEGGSEGRRVQKFVLTGFAPASSD